MAQSPSLENRNGQHAFEWKFVLEEGLARQVEAKLTPHLSPDPHADPALGNGYHIRTLYCDTPQRDVFHRRGRYRLFKFRLRQYGTTNRLFLERKSKRGDRVRKRRSTIPLDELGHLEVGAPVADWSADWYLHHVRRNAFAPVCLIEYDRVAYHGHDGQGPMRLTFDRQIHGGLTSQWSLARPEPTVPLLPGLVVCEFKFRGVLPSLLKSAIEAFQLTPCGVSKYRHCLLTAPDAGKGIAADA